MRISKILLICGLILLPSCSFNINQEDVDKVKETFSNQLSSLYDEGKELLSNLSFEKAKSNAIHIATIVKDNWRQLAKVNGCSNVEIERMKSAFEDESIFIKQNKKNEKEIDIDKFLKSY